MTKFPTHKRIKDKPYKNKDYLNYMHHSDKACIICGSREIELHHIRMKGQIGRIDSQVVPLCMNHHRGMFSPHGFDSSAFYEDYPKEWLLEQAEEFFNEYESL